MRKSPAVYIKEMQRGLREMMNGKHFRISLIWCPLPTFPLGNLAKLPKVSAAQCSDALN